LIVRPVKNSFFKTALYTFFSYSWCDRNQEKPQEKRVPCRKEWNSLTLLSSSVSVKEVEKCHWITVWHFICLIQAIADLKNIDHFVQFLRRSVYLGQNFWTFDIAYSPKYVLKLIVNCFSQFSSLKMGIKGMWILDPVFRSPILSVDA